MVGLSYLTPGGNVECPRDFENTNHPKVIRHSQEVLLGCRQKNTVTECQVIYHQGCDNMNNTDKRRRHMQQVQESFQVNIFFSQSDLVDLCTRHKF